MSCAVAFDYNPRPPKISIVGLIACIAAIVLFVLIPLLAHAGPKEQVAVAEAIVWAHRHSRPTLPVDVFQGLPKNDCDDREIERLKHVENEKEQQIQSLKNQVKQLGDGRMRQTAETDGVALEKGLVKLREKLPDPFVEPMRVEYIEPVSGAEKDQIHCVVITASWCRPCHKQESDNGVGNDQVSFEYVDEKDIAAHGLNELASIDVRPLTAWKDNSNVTRYLTGYQSTQDVFLRIQRNNPPNQLSGARPGGTYRIHARQQIRQAIEMIRQYAGEGKRISFEWDRSGLASFKLLSKSDRSALAIFGPAGQFHLSAPGAICPVSKIGFGYQVDGADFIIDPEAFRVPGLATKLSFQGRPNRSSPAQFFVLDDIVFFGSLIQAIQSITSLFSPDLDLQLPGQIEASITLDGDVLTVDWPKPPIVHFKEIVSGNLTLQKTVISEQSIHVDATGPWYVPRAFKHRDLPVD